MKALNNKFFCNAKKLTFEQIFIQINDLSFVLQGRIDQSIPDGPFQIVLLRHVSLVKQILHDEQIRLESRIRTGISKADRVNSNDFPQQSRLANLLTFVNVTEVVTSEVKK